MTSPINSVSQTSQPAAAGQAGIAAPDKIGSAEFASLFATLLGLTSPDALAGAAAGQADLAGLGQNLAHLGFNAARSGEAQAGPEASDTLTDLLDTLKTLAEALDGGEQVAPSTLDGVKNAIDALTALLGATPQLSAGDATATASGSGSQLSGEMRALLDRLAGNKDAIAPRLADIAGKLRNQLPDLAAKLDDLSQKLTQTQPVQNAQQALAAPGAGASAADTELAAALNALFGSKDLQATKAQSGASPGDSAKVAAPVSEPRPEAIAQASMTVNRATEKSEEPKAKTGPAAAIAQGADAGSGTAKQAAQSDPLLAAQTASHTTAKIEFSAAMKPATAAYQAPAPHLNMPHIAFEMVRQMRDGASRFQIRLDPPEMGKIDVKMDMDGNGTLNAKLTVERAETLDLLQRDSRALERALQQAGLDSGRTNLEFSLKQNPFARQDGQAGGGANPNESPFGDDAGDSDPVTEIPAALIYRGTMSPGGVNLLA